MCTIHVAKQRGKCHAIILVGGISWDRHDTAGFKFVTGKNASSFLSDDHQRQELERPLVFSAVTSHVNKFFYKIAQEVDSGLSTDTSSIKESCP